MKLKIICISLLLVLLYINKNAAESTTNMLLMFLSDMTGANLFRLVFSLAWWYTVPYIGGFCKVNSYHLWR